MSTERPWSPGAATGIGSMRGDDPREAAALVLGELPDLPHLPELPGRGVGADMIGRGAALLVELPVELVSTGWRIASHVGRDLRRARDFLARDLDALEEQTTGYAGALKLQAAGPWTLAAGLELPNGHKLVSDHGAVRDLIESLTEGLRVHLADVASRVPGATLVLQVDEPSLPAVLAAHVPTPSGYGTLRAIDPVVAEQGLRDVLAASPAGGRVVHCCAQDVPIGLLHAAGADAVSIDATLIRRGSYDALGEAVEAGVALWLGVVASSGPASLDAARTSIRTLWGELGFPASSLARGVVPTPVCGLADASDDTVRGTLQVVRDTGRSLLDED